MTDRELEFLALTEEYDEILNLPWTGKRLYGCYEIIRKYYMFRHGYELIAPAEDMALAANGRDHQGHGLAFAKR